VDTFALRDKSLKLFCDMVTSSAVYLFYELDDAHANVTVIDFNGAIFSTRFSLFNVQTLLRPLCRFIRSAVERQALEQHQYQDISVASNALQSIKIYELMGELKYKNAYLEPRIIGHDISQLSFINIFAVAEPGFGNQLGFTIFCDGKEFSALDYGTELFPAVARYILSCRQFGEAYPCYITDLDLSLCRDFLAPQTGIQLIHYLQIKSDIEQHLNLALQSIK
jgi:adenylate cyclase class 1